MVTTNVIDFLRKLYFVPPFLCLLLALTSVSAGDNDWRPITAEELSLKTPLVERDADAEALFWEVRIDDSSGERLSMAHYVRVKIFTERGCEKYSKFDIPFTRKVRIKDLAARVVKPDGSSVQIESKDIFDREIVKASGLKIKVRSFAVPNLEVGAIVEYRYKEVIEDAGASGMHLVFQRDIPVQTLSYYYKPYNKKAPNYQTFNFDDTRFVEDQKGFWVATRKNVPALKEEAYMPPEEEVTPWILLQSVRFNFVRNSEGSLRLTIKDPSSPYSYWSGVTSEKSYLTRFMNKSDSEISKIAAEITASASTPQDKLQKLYDYCQTTIKNLTYDPTFTDDPRKAAEDIKSIGDVLKLKAVPAQFVDLLFGAMANALGYETRILFAADRREKFFKPEMTNEQFIHLAAIAVKIGSNWTFYNPGLSFLPARSLIWYEEGVWALLVGDMNFAWVKTPFSGPDESISKRKAKFRLLEDGSLEGEVRIESFGQRGLSLKLEGYDKSDSKREEEIKNDIRRRISTADVSHVAIENATDPVKPFIYSYKIKVVGYAQKTGKRLFVQPEFFEYGHEALFSNAVRRYDIYFHYSWSEQDDIEIELPPGYSVESTNAPTPSSAGEISKYNLAITFTNDGRSLNLHRDFFFGGGGNIYILQKSYPQLKQFFDDIHQKDEHTIVLKQADSVNGR